MTDTTLTNVLSISIKEALTNVHTAVLAKVTTVEAKTINVLPVINRKVNDVSIQLPEFVEVPPIFLQGGSSYTAYPIAVDDYCLLIITERCFDRWYEGQDFVDPAEFRMHDYSDGFALVGINNLSGSIEIPTMIQRVGDYTQTGNVTHVGNYDIEGDFEQEGDMTIVGDFKLTGTMDVVGDITCSGNVSAASFSGVGGGTMTAVGDIETTGEVTADGVALSVHTHNYTWTDPSGSGTTDAPN